MPYGDNEPPVRPGNSGRGDYPRMLYHADGGTRIAQTPEEHDALHGLGWDTQPAPIHQRRAPTPSAAMAASDPYGIGPLIRQILNEVLNERNIGRRPK